MAGQTISVDDGLEIREAPVTDWDTYTADRLGTKATASFSVWQTTRSPIQNGTIVNAEFLVYEFTTLKAVQQGTWVSMNCVVTAAETVGENESSPWSTEDSAVHSWSTENIDSGAVAPGRTRKLDGGSPSSSFPGAETDGGVP